MTVVFVDPDAAIDNIRAISRVRGRPVAAASGVVDVGEQSATDALARLIAGVSAFSDVLAVQLALAQLALGAVVADVCAADNPVDST